MAQMVISRGDAFAVKHFGAALFAESMWRSKFRMKLRGPAPKQAQADAKARRRSMQTTPDMPIVSITDLERKDGDAVSLDMFGALSGVPVMGDEKLSGRAIPLKRSSMDVYIDQMRQVTDPGGKMSRHRSIYDLRSVCKANLAEWFGRLLSQLCQVHLAGARGHENTIDWCIPLEDHADFSKIVVNPIMPPTRNRRFLAGDATDITNLATTDALTLQEISKVRNRIDEMPLPPSPIKVPGDEASDDEDPMYLMMVTPRQWHYLENQQKANGHDWRTFLANALSRGRYTTHPLFKGGAMGMWNNILVRKMGRPIRFKASSGVREYNASGSIVTQNAAVATDRAVILGGQALAEAWGNARPNGEDAPSRWVEEWTDHRNALEVSGSLVGGYAKIRFKLSDDEVTDFGVMTLDTYAPDPASGAGATLQAALNA